MSGYSLRQLLTWCVDDQLIDEYDDHSEDGTVIIVRHGVRHDCSPDEAATWLTALFTQTDDRSFLSGHPPGRPAS